MKRYFSCLVMLFSLVVFVPSVLAAASHGEAASTYAIKGKGTINGPTRAFSNLIVKGMGQVNEIVVKGKTSVKGKLIADNSQFNGLKINGLLNLVNSTVNGVTDMRGLLHAKDSTFKDNILITTDVVELTHTQAKDIILNPINKQQKVYLRHQSSVDKIIFKNGNGLVYVDKDSIVKGNIIGGRLIRQL